ncbi:MAG TPA: hypothetical protein VGH27_05625, partial [Streptosporangiaceae bacterium]
MRAPGMFMIRPAAATALLLSALVGCTSADAAGPPTVCTDIGTPTGIGIEVAGEVAKFVGDTAQLTACWDGACHQGSLVGGTLQPASRSVDQGCAANGTCSATAVPTGGKTGFFEIPGLPAQPVQVRLTIPAAP